MGGGESLCRTHTHTKIEQALRSGFLFPVWTKKTKITGERIDVVKKVPTLASFLNDLSKLG
jgi:hypothetical protein